MSSENNREKHFQRLRFIIYTLCFTGIILFLCQYDNEIYETGKARVAAWAFLLFGIVLLTMQKVRWLNWQSLIITIGYFPFAFFECRTYCDSAELLQVHIVESVTRWMLFMVIADMIATKRVRKFSKISFFMVVLFAMAIVLMTMFSHGKSVYDYLPLLLMSFIPIEHSDWDEAVNGLLIAGFLSFVYTATDSFVRNPYFGVTKEEFMQLNPGQGGRWYGNFLNIGAFGQFLGLSTALAVCGLYKSSEKFGRLSVPYFLSWFWLAGSLFLSALNATRNYMVGIAGLIIILFIFGWRKSGYKGMIIRTGITLILITIAVVGIIRLGYYVLSPEFDYNKLMDDLMKTPLKLVPAGTAYIADKLRLAQEGFDSGYGEGNVFPPHTILSYLNLLTSFRLGICYDFLTRSSFYGTIGSGIQYGDYFAQNAHNQYVQTLYEYGFLAGGVYVIYALTGWIRTIVGSVKTRKEHFYIPLIVTTVMLGMWLGERSTIYYPLTFVGLFLFYPVLVDNYHGKTGKNNEFIANRWNNKKNITAAIVFASGTVISIVAALIIGRVSKMPMISLVDVEKHIAFEETDGLTEPDNGLYSAKDIRNNVIDGTILAEDEEIRKNSLITYWKDTGTVSFHAPKGETGNLIVLEFNAKTNCSRQVTAEVVCQGKEGEEAETNQIAVIDLCNEWNRYYIPFYAGQNDSEDELFFLRFRDSEEWGYLVNYSDFCLVDYGKETLLSTLKTGKYCAEKFESETVKAEDSPMWANTIATDGKYLYHIIDGTLYVLSGNKKYKSSLLKKNEYKTVGQLNGLGDTYDCRLYKDKKLLLVFSKADGAFFVDISKPSDPQILSHYEMSGECRGGEIYGNYAFLCNLEKGIEVVGIRNYSEPKRISIIERENTHYRNCFVTGKFLYAIDPDYKTMDIYDIQSKENIEMLGNVNLNGMGYGMAVKDDYLYVVTAGESRYRGNGEELMDMKVGSGSGVEIYDISKPEEPVLVEREKIDGRMSNLPNGIWEAKVYGDKLYVSVMCAGLYVYDITNPAHPVREKVFHVSAPKESTYYRELDPNATVMPYQFTSETMGSAIHAVELDGIVYSSTDMGIYRMKSTPSKSVGE